MQVTETLVEGLKRHYKVTLGMADLETRLSNELEQIKGKVNMPGFRPGKVPMQHLRRLYGRSVMNDVVQNAVNEANQQIIATHGLKLAFEPQINFPQGKESVETAMAAKGDLEFTVALEVLPKFEVADMSDVTVLRESADVPEADVEAALTRMANANRNFTPKEGPAEAGDKVSIDFVGKIDGEPFEGGAGEGIELELGSGSFIPGFEDQLLGAAAGESRTVAVTFPEAYQAAHLAGKAATFDVTVQQVMAGEPAVVDDAFAKNFGLDDLEALRAAVKGQMSGDLNRVARRKLKRRLLDALDAKYTFELPPTLVNQEFDGIWKNVEQEMQQAGKTFPDGETTEESARADYRKIAERRVRLGLVLAEIGEQAAVKVSDEEVTQALMERARQFPGQEKEVWEFYRKNPQAVAELRAPIFEEKVVDHILTQVTVQDTTISKEDLLKDDDGEDNDTAVA
jgi:trigger factor